MEVHLLFDCLPVRQKKEERSCTCYALHHDSLSGLTTTGVLKSCIFYMRTPGYLKVGNRYTLMLCVLPKLRLLAALRRQARDTSVMRFAHLCFRSQVSCARRCSCLTLTIFTHVLVVLLSITFRCTDQYDNRIKSSANYLRNT